MDREPPTDLINLDKKLVLPILVAALKEDIGPRDITTASLIPKDQQAKGELVVREEGVIAGLQVAEWTLNSVEPKIRFKPTVRDGDPVHPGKVAAFLEGPARGILTAERTALNFLGQMSGIATLTKAFVDRVTGTSAQIMDTRKTTPTLRLLEKCAVAAGGGVPHRMGLYDQVLIKDNHLKLVAARISSHRLSAIERAVREARSRLLPLKGARSQTWHPILIEVEVTTLQEFRQALSAQADIILLDNMKLSEIEEAARLRNAVSRTQKQKGPALDPDRGSGRPGTLPKPLLEVSGGVTLETVGKIAAAGIDRISVGALTHSAPALDLALELVG